jgi:hypothetical protein
MKGSALLIVALVATVGMAAARKTQQRPAQGATGQPVEMSSMAITFYNSGKAASSPPYLPAAFPARTPVEAACMVPAPRCIFLFALQRHEFSAIGL